MDISSALHAVLSKATQIANGVLEKDEDCALQSCLCAVWGCAVVQTLRGEHLSRCIGRISGKVCRNLAIIWRKGSCIQDKAEAVAKGHLQALALSQ